MSVVFDAGIFVQLERGDRVAMAFLRQLRESASIIVTATTLAEVWRGKPAGSYVMGSIRPEIVAVDERLAKRAGEILAAAGRSTAETLDALVVAVAERERASEIYTSDVRDIRALLDVSAHPRCAAIPV